jgi:hypothetical protein
VGVPALSVLSFCIDKQRNQTELKSFQTCKEICRILSTYTGNNPARKSNFKIGKVEVSLSHEKMPGKPEMPYRQFA